VREIPDDITEYQSEAWNLAPYSAGDPSPSLDIATGEPSIALNHKLIQRH
jgi:hypothetical protein